MHIFCDWFAFDYELEDGSRVIETYRETQWDELNAQAQATLEAWLTAGPLSGYELIAYEGQTLELREFMTGETCHVYEPAGRGAMGRRRYHPGACGAGHGSPGVLDGSALHSSSRSSRSGCGYGGR